MFLRPSRALGGVTILLTLACSQSKTNYDVAGPSAGSAPPAAVASPWGVPAEAVRIVEGSADEPPGFKAWIMTDPRRNEEGQILGSSPLTVEFDACRSTAGEGQTTYFYFDWDFDHRADVWGTGDACRQEHTYKLKPVDNAKGNETIVTNICVTNGDLKKHDPETYVSCREFTIVMPKVAAGPVGTSCHSIVAGDGGVCPTQATQFCVAGAIDPTSSAHAQAACEACVGVGNCINDASFFSIWYSGNFDNVFVYGSPGPICAPGPTAGPGDIGAPSGPCAPIIGRWAP